VLSQGVDHEHFVCKGSGSTASNARLQRRHWPNSTAPQPTDRGSRDEWRIEWFDDDSGCEVATFAEPNARDRAIRYADRQYGDFEEVGFDPRGPCIAYSSARDPSARSHACSAASAISEMEAAAPRCPVRCASAAARWSCQMAPIPSRASIDNARLSASVGRIIRKLYRRGCGSVFAADLSTNHAIADASARHTTP
jgi:hypothetical protein